MLILVICTKNFISLDSHSTWWWQPSWILPTCIPPSWISTILVFPLKRTHTCHDLFPLFAQKRKLDSFILTQLDGLQLSWILTMLDSDTAILNSDTLLSSLRFTQKHSHSLLTLTQTNSIWLKVIHSHLTWWWQPSWMLPSWILTIFDFMPFSLFFSKLTLAKIGSPFAQKKLHSFFCTQLDDGSHFEFCHLGFSHLSFSSHTSQAHICTKKLHSLILTQPDDGSHIVFSHDWIQTPCFLLWDWLQNTSLHSDYNSN